MSGAALVAVLAFPSAAFAGDSPFSGLAGAWSGSGNVRLENGKSERLKCKGYYNAKTAAALGMAINCGSAAFKINMRAMLTSAGGQVSGSWEEREFNQVGALSGKVTPSGFSLKFSGAISGTILVATSGSSQSVTISTGGPGFTGVNLQFAKSD
jgi:hypothetical protein